MPSSHYRLQFSVDGGKTWRYFNRRDPKFRFPIDEALRAFRWLEECEHRWWDSARRYRLVNPVGWIYKRPFGIR